MNILSTLLGFPDIKDVIIDIMGPRALLNNNTTVGLTILTDTVLGVQQPRGGDRLFTGSEQSFNHCFKQWLE